jgi:exopolysaccharide biosynthesis polyprenyl glycosylphosphotransferase
MSLTEPFTHGMLRRSDGPRSAPPRDAAPSAVSVSSFGRRRERTWLVYRLLIAADVTGLAVAFFTAQTFFGPDASSGDRVSPAWEALVFVLVLPIWVLTAQLSGLYGRDDRRPDYSTADDVVGVFAVVTVGTWLFWVIAATSNAVSLDAPRMIAFWAMAIPLVVACRVAARAFARRRALLVQRAVVVGTGDVGQLVARKLLRHPEYGIELVGFVDERPGWQDPGLDGHPIFGPPERVPELVEALQIDRVIVATPTDPDARLLRIVHRLRATGVQIDLVPHFFEAVDPRVDLHSIETLPLVGLAPVSRSRAARIVKRSLDVVVAGIALLAAAPLFAYVAWRIKRDSAGPVFFRQDRLGLHMQPFTPLKFRTMWTGVDDSRHRDYIRATMRHTAETEASGLYKLERADDVTPFGRFLRRTSLDELPQLVNVLRGEMSLVGPRPCIPYEVESFAPHHFDRFLVPPGITGLWQVAARARATFGEALDMDVAYVRGWSLGLDLRLICRTPLAMVHRPATA